MDKDVCEIDTFGCEIHEYDFVKSTSTIVKMTVLYIIRDMQANS